MRTFQNDTAAPVRHPLWVAMAMGALSGGLLSLTMPGYLNAGLIGWFALVPLLVGLQLFPHVRPDVLTIPFGLVWSVAVHNWYVSIFGWWGVFLIIGAGIWYAAVVGLGVRLQRIVPGGWKLLALPVVWTALEFLKFIAPVVRDWWFVLLAKSQWGFPAALQVLSVTGFPGLSFLLMLANVGLAALITDNTLRSWRAPAALAFVLGVVLWGASLIPPVPEDTFVVVATSDMANGPDIQRHSDMPQGMEGYYADTPEMSQALFDVNAALTREAVAGMDDGGSAAKGTAFVVWPENEFADADDARFMDQVAALARELDTYIVADTVWRAPTGMHDAAVLIGPDGDEVGRSAKVHLFHEERRFGFVPGNVEGTVFATPYGVVGLGVCYDYHYLDVIRAQARNGADIVLMPTDDDMHGNGMFPYYHATDGIFRAVEHRVAFAAAGTNGVSIVVDPYGRVTAMGGVNERSVVSGETFTVAERPLYTRWGDWFGWMMVAGAAGLAVVGFRGRS